MRQGFALCTSRQGINDVEKAQESVRLAPAGQMVSALDSLSIGEVARQRGSITNHITMMDAVNAEEVVRIETGRLQ